MKKYNEPQAVLMPIAPADVVTSSTLQEGSGANDMNISFGGFTFGN